MIRGQEDVRIGKNNKTRFIRKQTNVGGVDDELKPQGCWGMKTQEGEGVVIEKINILRLGY